MKAIGTTFNFGPFPPSMTNNFHPMKGPMVTQTLQDIITHEPFHWRGDRDGIEQFDGTFTNLQGAGTSLSTSEMQELKDFLATIRFAPNPFRQFDNSLSTNLSLPGHFALGRGVLPAGAPLPNGNALLGQALFRTNTSQGCLPCHTLPTGLGTDMRFNGVQWLQLALGTNAAHHIAAIELERNSDLPFKIPSLRNMFDKFGLDLTRTNSRSGFGFAHDGSVDSLVRFVQDGFGFTNDQATANVAAFLMSFTGSDLIPGSIADVDRSPGVASLDTPAAAGRQLTLSNSSSVTLLDTMIALASSSTSRVDLVCKGFKDRLPRGWFLDRASGTFLSDRQSEIFTPAALRALAAVGSEQTYTVVPRGCGRRIGIDRDADGYLDRDEIDFGSDPANPLSLATNTPPHLNPIADLLALKGRLITISITATDTDIPVQQLTFSLGSNAPAGATLNPTNGLFAWVPSGPAGTVTNPVTVIVTDSGSPNRSDSRRFNIIATDLNVGPLTSGANSRTLSWSAIAGLIYRLQYKNSLMDPLWLDLPGDITATNNIASKLDPGAVTNKSRFYRIIALP